MPADELTPVTEVWRILQDEVAKLHTRVNNLRAIQIENCGRDGRNGKLQVMREDVDELKAAMLSQEKALNKLAIRLAMLTVTASLAGGALVKLILGG